MNGISSEILDAFCREFISVFWSFFVLGSGRYHDAGDRMPNFWPSRANEHAIVDRTLSCTQVSLVKFSHIWTINNFSFLRKKNGEKLTSPTFTPEDNDEIKMCIELYPNGKILDNAYVAVYLHIVSCNKSEVNLMYELSIIDNKENKGYVRKTEEIQGPFVTGNDTGFKFFIERYNLTTIWAHKLLPNDSLTILCEGAVSVGAFNVTEEAEPIQVNLSDKSLIADDMALLLETEKLSDVTLSVGSTDFRAHKAILAARSPVFSAMFEHEMVERQQNRVVIIDIDHNVFKEMLHFIYTDRAPNIEKMAASLLAAADKYALERLKFMCEIALSKRLSKKNAVRTLIRADLYNANILKRRAINVINANAKEISKTNDFKSMIVSHPHLLAEAFSVMAILTNIKENK